MSTALINLEMKDARAAQSSAVVQRASLDGTIRERDGGRKKENKSFAQSQKEAKRALVTAGTACRMSGREAAVAALAGDLCSVQEMLF